MCRPRLTPPAILFLVGNLLDAVMTLTLMELRLVREVNPLLACAYQASPLAFVVGKLSMVQLSVLLPVRGGVEWARRVVEWSGAVIYTAVLTYQVGLLARLALSR